MAERSMIRQKKVVRFVYDVDGSAALQPQYIPEELPQRKKRTRPQRHGRREQYRNNSLEHLRVRAADAIAPMGVLGIVLAVVMAAMILQAHIELNSLNNQVVALRSELSELQTTENQLTGQYEQLFDMQSIESDMLNSGKMLEVTSGQQVYLDMSEPDTATVYEAENWLLQMAENLMDTLAELFG